MNERRKAKRYDIIESFSIFASLSAQGEIRFHVHDLSDLGMGLDLDEDVFGAISPAIAKDQELEVHLYLNQSLYLPLKIKVIRMEKKSEKQHLGVEVTEKKGPTYSAYRAFIEMISKLENTAQVN